MTVFYESNIDVSAIQALDMKYFPPQLVKQADTRLADKVLFGSDFPLLTPDRWLSEFADLPLRDSVRPGILKGNAIRMLGLDTTASQTGAMA